MNYWLLKTEPGEFSYGDLEKVTSEPWDGVKNFAALKNMRAMKPGDLAFIYHTGSEKAVIGVAQVVSEYYPDPKEENPGYTVIDVAPQYRLERPVTLKEIKNDPFFRDWELVRIPRLSIMPVTESYWNRIHELARQNPGS